MSVERRFNDFSAAIALAVQENLGALIGQKLGEVLIDSVMQNDRVGLFDHARVLDVHLIRTKSFAASICFNCVGVTFVYEVSETSTFLGAPG